MRTLVKEEYTEKTHNQGLSQTEYDCDTFIIQSPLMSPLKGSKPGRTTQNLSVAKILSLSLGLTGLASAADYCLNYSSTLKI
jgi:hypothetical protein